MATPDEIRAWMRARKLTQADLAEMCHTARITINRLLQGKPVRPSIKSHVELLMQNGRKHELVLTDKTEAFLREQAVMEGTTPDELATRWVIDAILERMCSCADDGSLEAAEDTQD